MWLRGYKMDHFSESFEPNFHFRYVPTSGSGVTIATGVDLGQQTESGLRRMGIAEGTIRKFRPYFGLTGSRAVISN